MIALALILIAPSAFAGAWVLPVGDAYFDQRFSYYRSSEFYDAEGDLHPQEPYQKLETGSYYEYGVLDRLSIGANLLLDRVQQDRAAQQSENIVLSDPELFATYQWWKSDNLALSIQPVLKLPSQSHSEEPAPQSGSTSLDGELALLAGYGFEWQDNWHYVEARLGYRHRRDEALNDQFRADLTLGYRFFEHWLATTSLYSTWATRTPTAATFSESNNQDYNLLKTEALLHFVLDDKRRVYAGTFYHMSGHNTGAGLGFLAGIAYRFSP